MIKDLLVSWGSGRSQRTSMSLESRSRPCTVSFFPHLSAGAGIRVVMEAMKCTSSCVATVHTKLSLQTRFF